MADPRKAVEEAQLRAQRAQVNALDAARRVEELRRRSRRNERPSLDEVTRAAREARLRSRRAHEAALDVHRQAAELLEERARQLEAAGDRSAAERARRRADAEWARLSRAADLAPQHPPDA
jgi:hypothetical protein